MDLMDSESLKYFLSLDAESQEKLMAKATEICLSRALERSESLYFNSTKHEYMRIMRRVVLVERSKNRFNEWSKETGVVDHVKALEAEYEKNCSTPKE